MRTRIVFWAALLGVAWTISAFIAGVVAILRDSKYLNDVMIPSLVALAVFAAFFVRLALRMWRRLGRPVLFARPS